MSGILALSPRDKATIRSGIEQGIVESWHLGANIDHVEVKVVSCKFQQDITVDGWVIDRNKMVVAIDRRHLADPNYADETARLTAHEFDHVNLLRSGHPYWTAKDYLFSEGRAQIAETASGRKLLPRSLFHDPEKAQAFISHALANLDQPMRTKPRGDINSYADWFTHPPANTAFPRHGGYALSYQIVSAYLKAKGLCVSELRKLSVKSVFSALKSGEFQINDINAPVRSGMRARNSKPEPAIIIK
jgi:uncharacterized protein YjaZ